MTVILLMHWQQYLLIVLLIQDSFCVHSLTTHNTRKSLSNNNKKNKQSDSSSNNRNEIALPTSPSTSSLKRRHSFSIASKSKNDLVAETRRHSFFTLTKSNLLSICLSLAYASIIVDTITLPAGLLLIKEELGGGSFSFSNMMFVATTATMIGKLLLGPPTDYFGGENTMKVSMAGMTILLLLCSVATKIDQLAPLWIAVNFIYATAWGACGKVVREQYPSSEWGLQLGFISGASRIASMAASLGFGRLLATGSVFGMKSSDMIGVVGGQWRRIFVVASLFQASVLLLYVAIDRFFIAPTENGSFSTSSSGVSKSSKHSTKNDVNNKISSLLRLTRYVCRFSSHLYSSRSKAVHSLLLRVNRSWNRLLGQGRITSTTVPTSSQSKSRSILVKRNIPISTNLPFRNVNDKYFSIVAEEDESVAQVLSRVTSYPSFWLMLLGKASLLMVGQFIIFIPSYLGTERSLLCSPAEASQISSFFAVSH